MLMPLSEGGCQYLLAGARANVGIKSGRYLFECEVVELMSQQQDNNIHGRTPQPRNYFRIGLSTAGSSLFLGDNKEGIAFDAEGFYIHDKQKTQCGAKFNRNNTVGVLVNMDPNSPNKNTVSLFKDGVRICKPQALPEALIGKALYPTVTFRNVTLSYNFSAELQHPLPFTCKTLAEASVKDVDITRYEAPKDGKNKVLFPVFLPDEGSFQWLDDFLDKNPSFFELSDRFIFEWAESSGIARPGGYQVRSCNDKPDWKFGLPLMDDKSIRKMVHFIAPMQERDYIVMEVEQNLCKESRKELQDVSFFEIQEGGDDHDWRTNEGIQGPDDGSDSQR